MGLKEATEKEYNYWKNNPIKKFYKDKFFISFVFILSTMLFMMFHPTLLTPKILKDKSISVVDKNNNYEHKHDYYFKLANSLGDKEIKEEIEIK